MTGAPARYKASKLAVWITLQNLQLQLKYKWIWKENGQSFT